METYLYLSLIPEALIASHLNPAEFGNYYSVGSQKHSRGQALFLDVAADFRSDYVPLENISKRCVPHEDGSPRRSTYLSIYRALEHVPLDALGKLHLATNDGRVLSLDSAPYAANVGSDTLHLYQELCPVTPFVTSKLAPDAFARYITDRANPVSVEKIVFTELYIGELADKPDSADVADLPYSNIDHLRDCLKELRNRYGKLTKVVVRDTAGSVLYRTVVGGFYIGDRTGLKYYPMPNRDELETRHFAWWRSALRSFVA
jgi:hypothetical protein